MTAASVCKPVLAEGYTISDDGLTYTFTIRPNVTFQNGDTLTAHDVVASWQMIMNKELPVWSRLGWDKIASIDVPDDKTAVVKTAQLFAPFLSSIAAGQFTTCAICPKSELDKGVDAFRERFDTKPIGTGPFRVKSVRQKEIILERYAKALGRQSATGADHGPHLCRLCVAARGAWRPARSRSRTGPERLARRTSMTA